MVETVGKEKVKYTPGAYCEYLCLDAIASN
jgi:hypothetical protein